jgi:hypothetical protein
LPYIEKHIVKSLTYADKGYISSVLKFMLDNKYDISFIPLYKIVERANKEDVQLLLDNGADVNKADSNYHNPLRIAVESGNQEMVQLLLADPRTDVNKADRYEYTPLYITAKSGNQEMVQLLLADPRTDVNKADRYKYTPLYIAAERGHQEIVESLIKAGADYSQEEFDLRPEYFSYEVITRLFKEAIDAGSVKTIENLLKYHNYFKDELIEDSQETLLSYAETKNYPEAVAYMRTQGFKPKATILTSIVQSLEGANEFLKNSDPLRIPGGVAAAEITGTTENVAPQIQQAPSSSSNKPIEKIITITNAADTTGTMGLVTIVSHAIGLTGLLRKLFNPNPAKQINSKPPKTEPNVREYITASGMSNYAQKLQSPEDKAFMGSILNDPRLKTDLKRAEAHANATFTTDVRFASALEEQRISSNSSKAAKKGQKTR